MKKTIFKRSNSTRVKILSIILIILTVTAVLLQIFVY